MPKTGTCRILYEEDGGENHVVVSCPYNNRVKEFIKMEFGERRWRRDSPFYAAKHWLIRGAKQEQLNLLVEVCEEEFGEENVIVEGM